MKGILYQCDTCAHYKEKIMKYANAKPNTHI